MTDFLDFDSLELNVDEQVNGAKEHPLKEIQSAVKMAYVGGLLFACHADDNTLQKEERSLVIGVAHSLGVGKEEVDELVEMIVGLTDKIAYLKEIVATLKDRKTILFFLCDMIKAMGADGELNSNAQKLIGAVEKLAQLDDHDEVIIMNYQKILSAKMPLDVEEFDLGNTTETGIEKSLIEWFAPAFRNSKVAVNGENSSINGNMAKDQNEGEVNAACTMTSNNQGSTDSCTDELVMQLAQENINKNMREMRAAMLEMKIRSAFTDLMMAGYPSIWYMGLIPEKKRYNAHISMMVKEDEHIVQIDTTLFGSGKEGLVITNRALYYKDSFEVPRRIEWKDLKSCCRDGYYIDFGAYGRLACTIGNDNAVAAFCNMLSKLIAELQADPQFLEL